MGKACLLPWTLSALKRSGLRSVRGRCGALDRLPLYPWGRGRGEFRAVFRGFRKAKMDVYEAHKTLWAMRVTLQTPFSYSLSPLGLLALRNSDFILSSGRCLLWAFPAGQQACGIWAGGGAEAPAPPLPSLCLQAWCWLPALCVCLRSLALCQRGSPVWV